VGRALILKHALVILSLFLLVGCSTYQRHVREARGEMAAGSPAKAAELLEERANKEGDDQILYMLDYGLALHEAGEIEKSNKVFIEVDRLAEVKDYISLTREMGSLFLSEALIQYKSERFENILINSYLALNFTLLGHYESALVECRRIDQKLYKMKLDNEDTRKSYFARYLSAMIWEEQKNWDSAYIDYKNAYAIDSSLKYIGKDLIRSAWRARRYEELAKWQKLYPEIKLSEVKKEARTRGELVFIYQQGWIPRKAPRPENFRFPYLVPQHSGFTEAIVEVNGQRQSEPTDMLYRVGAEAIRTLENDYKYLVAKKVAGFIAKEIAADQIRQKNETLGALALIAMHAADQADLRQWSTLPNSFQITKVSLPEGEHQVKVYARGSSGEKLIYDQKVQIKKGQKTFITERTFN
jgi:hypothetical protein